jgi:hypothetical protein
VLTTAIDKHRPGLDLHHEQDIHALQQVRLCARGTA